MTMKNRQPRACKKLEAWLVLNEISRAEFAEQIGVDRSVVYKWLDGTHRPKWPWRTDVIDRITNGAVQADDWTK